MRFNAPRRAIAGLSHCMLTLTLHSLERDGLVCERLAHARQRTERRSS
ncbi:hypothetical protein CWB41_07930 [Methylovirgula ligni]|nr:hypothetical protein CWB41_07930 [Methylovirgula ligni]